MGVVAAGAAIGAVIGGGAAAIQSGGDFNAIWKGALVGAAGGAIGGWAAPALSGAMGSFGGAIAANGVSLGGAIAAGGLGGMASGALSTALNGGNSSDYFNNTLFGGLTGAATGGLMQGTGANEAIGRLFSGGENGMVTGTPYTSDVTGATTPLTDAGASTLTTAPTASGVGGTGIDASGAVQSTITGAPQAAPTPTLSDSGYSGSTLESLVNQNAGYNQNALQNLGLGSNLGEGMSTPNTFQPNMSTPMNQAIGGGDYGVTTASGDVFDSAGNKLGVAPGFETPGTPTIRGSADVGTNSGWSMDKLFNWNTGKDMLGKVMAGQMMGNALKGVGSIAGMNEARQNQNQLMDLYNAQRNQYNMQNAAANQYQQQLQDTYSNPNEYLNSPEAVAARQQAMQKLLAQNAMAGRRTAGLPMQNQLMMNQLSNLNQYRQGLGTAARGAYPGSAEVMAKTLGATQAQSPTGNLFAGLGSMFAPAATYYLL